MSEHNKPSQDLNGNFSTLLIRIDERTKSSNERIESLCEKIEEINKDLKANYVDQKEFYPVKTICYSIVSVVGLAVLGALISLVIK